MKRLLLLRLRLFGLLIFLHSPTVQAEFGIGPCCAGVTCGIIPCDSSCAGKAYTELGAEVSQRVIDVSSSLNQTAQSTAESDSAITSLYQSLTNEFADHNQGLTSAIDALTIKKEAANTSLAKAIEASADLISSAISNAFIKITKLEQLVKFNELYGKRSQPDLIKSIGNHLEVNRHALMNSHTVESTLLSLYLDYDELARTTADSAKQSQAKSLLIIQRDMYTKLFFKALDGYLSNEEALKLAIQWTAMSDSNDLADGFAMSALSHYIAQVSSKDNQNIPLDKMLNQIVLLSNIEPDAINNVSLLNTAGLNRLLGVQYQIRSAQLQKLRSLSSKRQLALISTVKARQ
jgi:hypothetical protein